MASQILPGSCASQKVSRVLFGVGMRNAQRGGGDLPRANEWDQFRDVGLGVGTQLEPHRLERGRHVHMNDHVQSARASAIPASAPPRHSRLLLKRLASISPHWPCSKNAMVSNA